jgi:hypothetical protein
MGSAMHLATGDNVYACNFLFQNCRLGSALLCVSKITGR